MNRFGQSREFFIPKRDFTVQEDTTIPAIVYLSESTAVDGRKRFCAVGFKGKAQKPAFNFYFSREDRRAEHVAEFFEKHRKHAAMLKERKAQSRAPHTLKVGDVLYSSWGYEQTNIDFYVVTRVISDRMVEIAKCAANLERTSAWCSDYVKADASRIIGEPMRKLVDMSDGNPGINLTSYSSAFLWDGRELNRTSYA